MKKKVAISFDVEATSDSPATGSCIMVGFAVVRVDAIPDPKEQWIIEKKRWCIIDYNPRGARCVKEFWDKYPENLAYIEANAVSPLIVAQEISDYLANLPYDWFFVADPASFDWQWLNQLYDRFGPENKTYLGYKAICMDGMEKALSYMGYSDEFIDDLITPPPEFNLHMTHLSDDDAAYQAYGYLKLRRFLEGINKHASCL
jgi:hypothetical protein